MSMHANKMKGLLVILTSLPLSVLSWIFAICIYYLVLGEGQFLFWKKSLFESGKKKQKQISPQLLIPFMFQQVYSLLSFFSLPGVFFQAFYKPESAYFQHLGNEFSKQFIW